MNEQLKQQAEKIFADNFKHMKRGNVSNFRNDFPTLYNKVIIPSIVHGISIGSLDAFESMPRQSQKIQTITRSKIQPGQKLNDGDYVVNLTLSQWNEIIYIENKVTPFKLEKCDTDNFAYHKHGLLFIDGLILHARRTDCKTKYSFDDFKQLCENTFGNE